MTAPESFDPATSPHYPMLKELFETPYYGVASGQPSRSDFAYWSTETGVPLLYMWDPREEVGHAVTSGDRPVLGLAAVHPRRPWLAYTHDTDGDENYIAHLADLAEQEARTVSTEPLGRLSGLHWTRDEQLIAVGNDMSTVYVRRMSLDGEVDELFSSDEQIMSSDYDMASGTVVAAVGRGAGTRLGIVEPRGGVSAWVSETDDSEDKNPSVHTLARLLAYTSDGINESQMLIVRSYDSLQEVARVEVPGEIESIKWQSGKLLIASIIHDGDVALRRLDIKSGEWSEPLSGIGARSLAMTGDGLIWSGSSFDRRPGIYTLIDGETVPLVGGGEGGAGVTAESHWYESFDGRRIQGWLLRSSVPDAPLVVEAHGGPEWYTGNSWAPHILALVHAGYSVFAPNFRGSTSFGNDFKRLIIGDLGGAELEDVLYGARYATDLLGLGSKPAIVGGSYGGYLTLMALGTQPDDWAGGVAFVPPADLREDYELADAHFRKFHTHFMGGTPDELPDLYRERSPITHVGRIKQPVLVLHGENDPRCPVAPVRRMAAEAARAGAPMELHVNAGEGHGAVRRDAAIVDMALALGHLDRIFGRGA